MGSKLDLVDLLLIPTSIVRLVHETKKEGYFEIREEYKTKNRELFWKIYPYASATVWEGARLYGYYELFKNLI